MSNSKLLRVAAHEAENDVEVLLRQDFEFLQPQLKPPFPLTIPSPSEYSQLNRAILYGVLTEPHSAKIHFTHLNAIVTDGYSFFVNLLLKLVFESFPKFLDPVKIQLIWVTRKLVDVSAVGVENLLVCLMRHIVGGDFSDGNLWLSTELIKIFLEKWDWLLEEPLLLTSALFTYLRLLADHYRLLVHPKLDVLKRMEIDFCVRVLRMHFQLCLRIGRDLVRLLQDLVHIPEFGAIWKDLLLNPVEFKTPGFSDVSQLYCSRTSSRYLLLRVTPEMETQLRFLLTRVRWGCQKRYQAWFARKFLCGPESETVISDIVRFICCAHHPPNEIIQSDVIPRWAIIGWLLKCCRKNHVEANTKLALFYDWLFFDERVDNIMNIEPAILLMVHSIPKYIDITHSLLEFLFRLMDNYDVERKDFIFGGVSAAFGILVRKGVIHSMVALTACNSLSPYLKERLSNILSKAKAEVLGEAHTDHILYCPPPPLSLPSPSNAVSRTSMPAELRTRKRPRKNGFHTKAVDALLPVLDNPVPSCSPQAITNKSPVDIIEGLVQNLGEAIKQSNKKGLEILEEILFLFANLDCQSVDITVTVDSLLCPEVLARQITEAFELNGYKMFVPLKYAPKFSCDDEIQSATALITCTYIFSQNKRTKEMMLFWSRNGYPVGPRLLSYASRLAYEAHMIHFLRDPMGEKNSAKISNSEMPLLKYHIDMHVSFLSAQDKYSHVASASMMDAKFVDALVEGAFASYRSFLMLSHTSHKEADTSLTKLLVSDLLFCCGWEVKRLKPLFSSIFCHLSDLSTAKEEVIQLLVDHLDHLDFVSLQFEICLKRFSMFGEDTEIICNLIMSSLNWSTVEQQKFWALMASELAVSKVRVEKVVVDFFCSSSLDSNVHSIAIGGLFTLCSRCAPTPGLVGAMMSLPDNIFGGFAAAILATWVVSNCSMLFNSVAEWLEKINMDGGAALFNLTNVRINQSSISGLLNFLENTKMEGTYCMGKVSVSIPELKAKLAGAAIVQNSR